MTSALRAGFRLAFAVILAPCAIEAQATQPAPVRADTTGIPKLAPTPAALALADSLLREMDLERVMQSGAMSTFDAGIEAQPAMAQFRDIVLTWAKKHLSWAEFGPPMIRVYAEMFTEAELRAFLTFYRTPAGRQLARLTPELTRRGAQMGAEIAAKHTPELQQLMQARMMELQGAGARPPGSPPPA